MSEWTCPNCRGGFPTPAPGEGNSEECPWCGQPLDASYELEDNEESS